MIYLYLSDERDEVRTQEPTQLDLDEVIEDRLRIFRIDGDTVEEYDLGTQDWEEVQKIYD